MGYSNGSIVATSCFCCILCLGIGTICCHLIELFLSLSLLFLVFGHSSFSFFDELLDSGEGLWFHFWLVFLDVVAAVGWRLDPVILFWVESSHVGRDILQVDSLGCHVGGEGDHSSAQVNSESHFEVFVFGLF